MNHIVSTMAHIFSYLIFSTPNGSKWADGPNWQIWELKPWARLPVASCLWWHFSLALWSRNMFFFCALPDSKGTSFGALRERHRNMNTSKYKIFHRKAACLRPAITAMADLNGIRFHRRGKCHIVPRVLRMGTKYELTNSSGQNLLLMLQRLQSSGSLGPAAEIFPHLYRWSSCENFHLVRGFSVAMFDYRSLGSELRWVYRDFGCVKPPVRLELMDVPGPSPLKKCDAIMDSSDGDEMERFSNVPRYFSSFFHSPSYERTRSRDILWLPP